METEINRARAGTGSWSWILQALSGILVFVLIALHMLGNHFVVSGGLRTYTDVVAYLATPFILGWEVVFLVIVTWHALLGVRAILFDLGLSRSAEGTVTWVLTLIGILTVAYGLWLTYTIVT